ncbi:hypothetical protein NM688_g6423 [Phlebia brevispora]|uniref:Uncharacterized protein n=1 Tax=Phlebia brevispora TaxID=194682 RepID=A0ACC1SGH5_9APHY|nr:hypothetical protein NM688_g6423 [Phlebia brevispora]
MADVTITKDNTYGATFIGFALSCLVFGIVCTQAWTYFQKYPFDRLFYKILVGLLLLLTAVDQAFIGHASYYYSITYAASQYMNAMDARRASLIGSDSRGSGQSMLCHEVSNGNRPITAVILILVVAQLAIACVYTARGLKLASLDEIDDLKVVGSLSLCLGVATDIVTAAALCFFLHNLKTGYSKDDSLVNRLTVYAVNTGVLTSAVSLATMILYNIMPSNFIFMACYFVLSKLYLNSFLATLNTRRVTRGRGTDAETATMPTFLMVGKITKRDPNQFADHVYPPSLDPGPTKADMVRSQQTALEVGIEHEVTVTRDSMHYGVAV